MYDPHLKAQRDYQWGLNSAREEGRQEGLEEARREGMEKAAAIGAIRLLQELLGDQVASSTSLRELTIGDLSTMRADLKQRLLSRES